MLTVLDSDQVQAIHEATLRILSETGIVLTHLEAREQLTGSGATVRGDRVVLPPDLVGRALKSCPGQVTIRGRGGQRAVLGTGSLHWHNLGGAREVYEGHPRERRPATVRDVQDAARLLDALDGVTTVTPFFTPQDVPGPLMPLAMVRHTLPHTTKPVHGPGLQTPAEVRYTARLGAVLGRPEEFITAAISPVSPLTFPDDTAAAIIEAARLGLPLTPLPCPIAGATAPMTLAGALAQQNAEVLAAVVLAQAARPGLPILYCGRLAVIEPRTGLSTWGGVETGLASAATVQIAHSYGLPANVYGLCTDAHTEDLESGYERALNAVIPAMAGADELSGIGELGAGVAGSFSQMVCDNDIAGAIRRLRTGLVVDQENLAEAVIAGAMDGARDFLSQRHTVRALRAGEVYIPHLAERRGWEAWCRDGQQTAAQRAQAEAQRLLIEHHVPPLTADQERELDQIMQEAERELVDAR
jgi:trimethylamine--corrinoid protein Co-methyltransferase